MRRLLISLTVAALSIVAVPDRTVAAQRLVEIVDFEIIDLGPGMTAFVPCLALNRGIDTASRVGGADFRLHIDLMYISAGMPVIQSVSVPVRDTDILGYTEPTTALVTTFIFTAPIELESDVEYSIQLTRAGQ